MKLYNILERLVGKKADIGFKGVDYFEPYTITEVHLRGGYMKGTDLDGEMCIIDIESIRVVRGL